MYRDGHGIIGQVQPDGVTVEGGDSVNWMGHWLYLNNGVDKYFTYDKYVDTFKVGFGAWVRHPYPHEYANKFGWYYKNPWNGCMSRDQLTGVLACLVAAQKSGVILQMILHHMCRLLLFAYNTIHNGVNPKTASWKFPDITFMDIWAMYLRGFGSFSWVFWPVLCVLDLHMLLNTMYYNLTPSKDPISFAIKMLVMCEHKPTFISKLCAKILNKKKLIDEVGGYWNGWRKTPEMPPLYKRRIEKL